MTPRVTIIAPSIIHVIIPIDVVPKNIGLSGGAWGFLIFHRVMLSMTHP
jgi:hypothetical protein